MFNLVKSECRSTTGRNLRRILLSTNQSVSNSTLELKLDEPYFEIPSNESWRVPFVQEILGAKYGKLKIENFVPEELDTLLRDACCT